MVRGIMYFDFGAKMLGKMLTEENDSTSLTSFFSFCLKMHLLRHVRVVPLDTHFIFFLKIHLILRVGIWFGFD